MAVGIEATKSAVHGVFGVVANVIKIARSAGSVMTEVRDLSPAEIVELIVQVATVETPALLEEIKK